MTCRTFSLVFLSDIIDISQTFLCVVCEYFQICVSSTFSHIYKEKRHRVGYILDLLQQTKQSYAIETRLYKKPGPAQTALLRGTRGARPPGGPPRAPDRKCSHKISEFRLCLWMEIFGIWLKNEEGRRNKSTFQSSAVK